MTAAVMCAMEKRVEYMKAMRNAYVSPGSKRDRTHDLEIEVCTGW